MLFFFLFLAVSPKKRRFLSKTNADNPVTTNPYIIIDTFFDDFNSNSNGGAIFSNDRNINIVINNTGFHDCHSSSIGGAFYFTCNTINLHSVCGVDCTAVMQGQFCDIYSFDQFVFSNLAIRECGNMNKQLHAIYMERGRLKGTGFNATSNLNLDTANLDDTDTKGGIIIFSQSSNTELKQAIFYNCTGADFIHYRSVSSLRVEIENIAVINNNCVFPLINVASGNFIISEFYSVNNLNYKDGSINQIFSLTTGQLILSDAWFDESITLPGGVTQVDVVYTKGFETPSLVDFSITCYRVFITPTPSEQFSPSHTFTPSRTNILNEEEIRMYNAKVQKVEQIGNLSPVQSVGLLSGISLTICLVGVALIILYIRVKMKKRKEISFESQDSVDYSESSSYYTYYYVSYSYSYESLSYSTFDPYTEHFAISTSSSLSVATSPLIY